MNWMRIFVLEQGIPTMRHLFLRFVIGQTRETTVVAFSAKLPSCRPPYQQKILERAVCQRQLGKGSVGGHAHYEEIRRNLEETEKEIVQNCGNAI